MEKKTNRQEEEESGHRRIIYMLSLLMLSTLVYEQDSGLRLLGLSTTWLSPLILL